MQGALRCCGGRLLSQEWDVSISREMAGARVRCLLLSGRPCVGSRMPGRDAAAATCLGRIRCSKIRSATVSIWLALFRRSGTLKPRRLRAWRSGAVGGEPDCMQPAARASGGFAGSPVWLRGQTARVDTAAGVLAWAGGVVMPPVSWCWQIEVASAHQRRVSWCWRHYEAALAAAGRFLVREAVHNVHCRP